MSRIKNYFGKFIRKNEEGASLVEYGLLVGLISVVCIVVITTLGTTIRDLFQQIVDRL